jgi:hypothetical protein
MVSRENKVIVGFGAAALLIMYGMVILTDLPQWVSVAALFVVGILVPQVINNRLDRSET